MTKIEKLLNELQKQNKDIKKNFEDIKEMIVRIAEKSNILKQENERLKKALKEEKVVEIEVGGDYGDGNVEVVKKPLGIKVIVKDWDGAYLPEGADDVDKLVPQERLFQSGVAI